MPSPRRKKPAERPKKSKGGGSRPMRGKDNSRGKEKNNRPIKRKSRGKTAGSLLSIDSSPTPNSRVPAFPIVGVGASAGGLEAFTQLLRELPPNTGMAFVMVQHLAPKHESMLTEILSRATTMPVREVQNGLQVKPDHVYVIPPNTNMALLHGHLNLMPRPESGSHFPIDYFLESLTDDQDGKAIGVILSGTASDGARGLAAIKAGGGITFAQDPTTAKYDGMPRSAVAAGVVDFVLSPSEIAHELVKIGKHPYVKPLRDHEADALLSEPEDALSKVFVLLRRANAVDFTYYKHSTIRRRIMRRMVLHRIDTLDQYVKYLQRNPAEVHSLYQDILITVTTFFRDFEAFEALKERVFPEILKHRAPDSVIRVWVPGCATGEEAYSIAIAWMEFLDERPGGTPVQIFATDISDKAIEKARAGIYPEAIAADVSPDRLRRFFVKMDGSYQINKAIRDTCVFARQDIAKDPPFSKLDLISCRNLLIYLGPVLQNKVVPIFHYALNESGFLMLGNSETIGPFSELFSLVDKKHKFYAKKTTLLRMAVDFALRGSDPGQQEAAKPIRRQGGSGWDQVDLQKETDRIVLAKYAPAGVTINDNLEILQFRGHTSPFLEPFPGAASLNLLKMLREDLALEVRTAVHEAKKKNTNVRRPHLQVRSNGQTRIINLEVNPIKSPLTKERFFLILFEEATVAVKSGPPAIRESNFESRRSKSREKNKQQRLEGEVRRLGQELEATQTYLHATIEEQETMNEELRSANEEIQSSNEELQSTNEELETAKEELQSTNEELTTVNEELNNRNAELNQLNNDLHNLLTGVNIPIVMLGQDLRIRRFTAPAGQVLNLIATDVGRPIGDITPNIEIPDLKRLVSEVVDSLITIEQEVHDRTGHWYSMRVRPYRTADGRIDGVVISLLDVDALKSTGEQLDESRRLIEGLLATAAPLVVLDSELRVKAASPSFCSAFDLRKSEEFTDCLLGELGGGDWNIPQLHNLLLSLTPANPQVRDFEIVHDFKELGPKRLLIDAHRIDDAVKGTFFVLLEIREFTAPPPG